MTADMERPLQAPLQRALRIDDGRGSGPDSGPAGEASLMPRDEAHLAMLLSQVNRARAELRATRHAPLTSTSQVEHQQCCASLADAMERYADAAANAGIPLPYRYRDELRLYRRMAH
jgi:hypothetical protein